MKVRDLMATRVHAVRAEDEVAHARHEMLRRNVSHLPVVDSRERFVGLVGAADIVFGAEVGEQAEHRHPFLGQTVAAVMRRAVTTLPPGMSDVESARLFVERGTRCAPVLDGDRVLGMVSEVDLLRATQGGVPGAFQVRDAARERVPRVHRHATIGQVIGTMVEMNVREVLVTEGQSFITQGPSATPKDLRNPTHAGLDAVEYGVVGRINLKALLASSWFDRHVFRQPTGKRVDTFRRREAAGPVGSHQINEMHNVAEDVMRRDVRALKPDDDGAYAARVLAEGRFSGLPVFVEGREARWLDRRDLLAKIVEKSITA